jgi:hypothetical protein
VSDDSHVQVTPKDENSSLSLSKVRSGLIARGRRDAALLLAVPCNKCGERKDLAFAGCVCTSCSEALDKQWASSTATDWVLIAKQLAEEDGERPWYAVSVATRLSVLKLMESDLEQTKRGSETTGVPHKESEAQAGPVAVPSSERKQFWPPLGLLASRSPDAESGELPSGEELCRYVFRGTTYAQMKLHWAKSDSTGSLVIGEALPDDRYKIDVQTIATYLNKVGVPPEEVEEASEAQVDKWWEAATEGRTNIAFIRPANPEEIGTHNALLRDQKRHEPIAGILEKWGFDSRGIPLAGSMDDDEWKHRGLQAWEEVRRTFEGLGLLKGSLFDYEEELRANFVKYDSVARTSTSEVKPT